MTTLTGLTGTPTVGTPSRLAEPARAKQPGSHSPIPPTRLLWVELTKMFNTRSGFWLMASIGIFAVLATIAVIVFAPDTELTYATFSAAVGMPLAIIVPMVAILSVTSEWTQRSGLTTFTLVPRRGRVLAAKVTVAVAIGVLSMVLAMGIGAIGHLVGTAIAGVDPAWDVSAANFGTILLGNVLGMLMGFTLGVVLRSSAAAIVGYFVFAFVLPNVLFILGTLKPWFADAQPWVDFYYSYTVLFENVPTGEQWAQIATSGLLWLVLPLLVGLRLMLRAEVK